MKGNLSDIFLCKPPEIPQIRSSHVCKHTRWTLSTDSFRWVWLKVDSFSKTIAPRKPAARRKNYFCDRQTFVFRAPPFAGILVGSQCNVESAVLVGNRRSPWELAGEVDFLGRSHQESIDFLFVKHQVSLVVKVFGDSWIKKEKVSRLTNFGNWSSITDPSSSGRRH